MVACQNFILFLFLRDMVSKQGTYWNLKQVAAHVTFPPDAVSEDKTVTVFRCNSSVCSPPLNDNEAIVSGIIELSTDNAQGFEFSKAVTLVISHCAADIKGYEVVAKMLIDRDTNVWSDISQTVDMRSLAGKEKALMRQSRHQFMTKEPYSPVWWAISNSHSLGIIVTHSG